LRKKEKNFNSNTNFSSKNYNNTMSTGDEIEDLNEITPLLANQHLLPDANANSNELTTGADKEGVDLFPSKLIFFISTCLTLLSVTMIGII